MEIDISELRSLRAGHRGDLQVGVLPFEVRKYLRISRDRVVLSTQSIRHILTGHGDHISVDNLLLLPSILEQGMWIADRPLAFAVVWQAGENDPRYKVALKTTADHSRTYVRSFHRMKARQTRSVLRRGDLVREHWVK